MMAPSRLRRERDLPADTTRYGHDHPKTDIVVEAVRLVPVAVRTAGVPLIVVPRAPAHHPSGRSPAPYPSPLLPTSSRRGGVHIASDFCQPPSKRPTWSTMRAACWY